MFSAASFYLCFVASLVDRRGQEIWRSCSPSFCGWISLVILCTPQASWRTGFQEILASASHLLQEDWEYRFALSHLAFFCVSSRDGTQVMRLEWEVPFLLIHLANPLKAQI